MKPLQHNKRICNAYILLSGGKMMTFRKVKKILIKNGWVHVRTNGSHVQFKKPGIAYIVNIPYHGSKDLSIGVLKNLEKGTGLSFTK